MRIFIKLCIVALLFTSCDETESATFDPATGQTGIGFGVDVLDISVPVGDITSTTAVFSTTLSAEDRTFNVAADAEQTNLAASDYVLGTVFIPADSHEGTLDVTFNYDGLEDFVAYLLVVELDVPDGVQAFSSLTYAILREFDINEFICSDLTLEINFDNFGSENTWEITNAGGVVESGGPYPDGGAGTTLLLDISLAPGDYTMTFFDAFGDGLFDGNTTGSYNLFCAAQPVVSYAGAVGNFGGSNADLFTINED